MSYCPRCREDGTQYDLDCGCTVCEDCHTAQEIVEGVCCRCRAEMAKVKNSRLEISEAQALGYTRLCAHFDGEECHLSAEKPNAPDETVELQWPQGWGNYVRKGFVHSKGFHIV